MNVVEPNQNIETNTGLSIIPVSKEKVPMNAWKKYQNSISPRNIWEEHYAKGGYVGIITGKVNHNLEIIDIDVKNDPSKTIDSEYRDLIPKDLLDKLIIQTTPNGGQHYIYCCPSVEIESNQQLALSETGEVIIETRGEGGYFCHHLTDYNVIQGDFTLNINPDQIPIISKSERALLLGNARSLTRHLPIPDKEFKYQLPAINDFNKTFDIVSIFEKHDWKIVSDDGEKVQLLRPGSEAQSSGTYIKENKLFYCFSTSTEFVPKRPYNHFQILQLLEADKDYRKAVSMLPGFGYEVNEATGSQKKKITEEELAQYLNEQGLRYDLFIQDLTMNGKIIEERDANTLYIDAKRDLNCEIPRTKFEDTIKSHYITTVHPVMDFIEKYKDRKTTGMFEKWMDCLVLKNKNINKPDLTYFFKKWYVGLVAQALGGEFPNEFFLSLISTSQGIGKTTILRKNTIPEELQDYRKEHSISDDEDFKVLMCQALLIIDDEMDGRTFNEDKTFKSILSRTELTLRRKYDRRISTLVRRTSFAGCGNQINVVRERQNRRIIPIEIESIDFKKTAEIDLIDLFMEAYQLYASGFKYSYEGTDSAKINLLAGDYFLKNDIDELIDENIDLPVDEKDIFEITPLEIMAALNYKFPLFTKKLNAQSLGKIMNDKGFVSKRVGRKKTTKYQISKISPIKKMHDEIIKAEGIFLVGFSKEPE